MAAFARDLRGRLSLFVFDRRVPSALEQQVHDRAVTGEGGRMERRSTGQAPCVGVGAASVATAECRGVKPPCREAARGSALRSIRYTATSDRPKNAARPRGE